MLLKRARKEKKALPLEPSVWYIFIRPAGMAGPSIWGILISLFLLFFFTLANGQETKAPQIKEMKVALWPEYDDPRVLMMYRGIFGDGAPSRVTFLVPKGGEVNQACSLTAKEEHLCQVYDLEDKGDYRRVSYNLPEPRFLLEIYMPLTVNEANKSARLTFSSLYPVQELTLEVQKPLRAENFRTVPATTLSHKDDQGLEYSTLRVGELKAGKKVDFRVDYQKADSRPSVAKRSGPGGGATASSSWFLIITVALFSAAVIMFLGYLTASRRRRVAVPVSARPAQSVDPEPAAGEGQFRPRFCFKCGGKLVAGASFCSSCGAGLTKVKD